LLFYGGIVELQAERGILFAVQTTEKTRLALQSEMSEKIVSEAIS
jgi:hypothetical protein